MNILQQSHLLVLDLFHLRLLLTNLCHKFAQPHFPGSQSLSNVPLFFLPLLELENELTILFSNGTQIYPALLETTHVAGRNEQIQRCLLTKFVKRLQPLSQEGSEFLQVIG